MNRLKQLRQLAQLAQIRADRELRQFAAIGAHVAATRAAVVGMRADLDDAVAEARPGSVEDLRLGLAMVGYRADTLFRAERDLERMLPGYEAARARAAREFGRARAMDDLVSAEHALVRELAQKRQERG